MLKDMENRAELNRLSFKPIHVTGREIFRPQTLKQKTAWECLNFTSAQTVNYEHQGVKIFGKVNPHINFSVGGDLLVCAAVQDSTVVFMADLEGHGYQTARLAGAMVPILGEVLTEIEEKLNNQEVNPQTVLNAKYITWQYREALKEKLVKYLGDTGDLKKMNCVKNYLDMLEVRLAASCCYVIKKVDQNLQINSYGLTAGSDWAYYQQGKWQESKTINMINLYLDDVYWNNMMNAYDSPDSNSYTQNILLPEDATILIGSDGISEDTIRPAKLDSLDALLNQPKISLAEKVENLENLNRFDDVSFIMINPPEELVNQEKNIVYRRQLDLTGDIIAEEAMVLPYAFRNLWKEYYQKETTGDLQNATELIADARNKFINILEKEKNKIIKEIFMLTEQITVGHRLYNTLKLIGAEITKLYPDFKLYQDNNFLTIQGINLFYKLFMILTQKNIGFSYNPYRQRVTIDPVYFRFFNAEVIKQAVEELGL